MKTRKQCIEDGEVYPRDFEKFIGSQNAVLVHEKYNELLMAVSIKHPNETRHETALRYILQAEQDQNNVPMKAND